MKGTSYMSGLAGYLLNRRGRRAAGQVKQHRTRRASPFRLESLEARVLLSADLAGAVQQTQVTQAIVQQQAAPAYVEGTINVAQASHDSGYAYFVQQDFGTPADTNQTPTSSPLRIYENGRELGPAHALYVDIEQQGAGRFVQWGNGLYFSASDNSNPATNGRTYTYRVSADSATTTPTSSPSSTTSTPSSSPTSSPSYVGEAINVAQASHDSGYAYFVQQDFGTPADTNQTPTSSPLRIYENGRELGPAHALYVDIEQQGAGRFVQWGNGLYFSASDNSNPATNGRTYTYRVSADSATITPTSSPSSTPSSPSSISSGAIKTDLGVYAEPSPPSLPTAGSKATDPTFGTTILRLTDGSDGNSDSQVEYSYYPTFNTDCTRAYVLGTYGGMTRGKFYTFNPTTFTADSGFVPNSPASGLQEYGMIWSGQNPDIIFGNSAEKVWSYHVPSNSYTLVKDLTGQMLPGGHIQQMSRSMNDDVFAFTLTDSSWNPAGYIVWKRSTDQILLKQESARVDEVQVDKSGMFLSVQNTDGNAQVWNLQTKAMTQLTYEVDGYFHEDTGYGRMLTAGPANDLLYRDLSSPHSGTSLVPGYISYATQQDHFSMLADNESWALVGRYSTSGGPVLKAFDNEIAQIATDGSNRVRRLAHHHSVVNDYNDQPRANISRDGQFVAFTSDWGNANGRRDVYIVQIPPA